MTDQRNRILSEAVELYLDDGLAGFSMRKLARAVGVTAPALYRHYPGKEHVLADVLRQAFREFSTAITRALEAPTPEERLFRAAEGYLDFALGNPRWYSIMFSAPERLGMEAMPEDIEAMGCAIHQFWIDRARECMDAGMLREDDPARLSVTMWSHAHGLIDLYHQGHFQVEEEEFRRIFEESGVRMFRGVATEAFADELARRYAEAGAAAGA